MPHIGGFAGSRRERRRMLPARLLPRRHDRAVGQSGSIAQCCFGASHRELRNRNKPIYSREGIPLITLQPSPTEISNSLDSPLHP